MRLGSTRHGVSGSIPWSGKALLGVFTVTGRNNVSRAAASCCRLFPTHNRNSTLITIIYATKKDTSKLKNTSQSNQAENHIQLASRKPSRNPKLFPLVWGINTARYPGIHSITTRPVNIKEFLTKY